MSSPTEMVVLTITELALLLISFWGLGYLWETHQNGKPGRVIYHGSNPAEQGPLVVNVIQRYRIIPEDSCLIEPGAGMATMSHYLARRFSWKSIEVIEVGRFIQFLGRIRFLFRENGIRMVTANLLTYTYPPGSVVYCYLFPSLITSLYTSGRLDGCLVISLTFAIQDCLPTEEIVLKSWQQRLLVYDFRPPSKEKAVAVKSLKSVSQSKVG